MPKTSNLTPWLECMAPCPDVPKPAQGSVPFEPGCKPSFAPSPSRASSSAQPDIAPLASYVYNHPHKALKAVPSVKNVGASTLRPPAWEYCSSQAFLISFQMNRQASQAHQAHAGGRVARQQPVLHVAICDRRSHHGTQYNRRNSFCQYNRGLHMAFPLLSLVSCREHHFRPLPALPRSGNDNRPLIHSRAPSKWNRSSGISPSTHR